MERLLPNELIQRYESVQAAYERAYKTLKAATLEGYLSIDSNLTENDLSHALGMSRTPIRKALSLLDEEGIPIIFIQHDKRLDEGDKKDIIDLLANLEGQAASLAAQRATDDWVSLLWEVNANMKALSPAVGIMTRIRDLDMQFHLLIARGAQNRFLYSYIKEIRATMREHRARDAMLPKERHALQTTLYDALIEALRAQDADAAQSWARTAVFSTHWLFSEATLG